MAIRPEMRRHYGATWRAIARATVAARGSRCEICGLGPPHTAPLTCHHLDRNPENNDAANLLVCCPRHHFAQEALINAGHRHPGQLELVCLSERP